MCFSNAHGARKIFTRNAKKLEVGMRGITLTTIYPEETALSGVRIAHRAQSCQDWIKLAISGDGLQAGLKEVAFHLDPNQPIITGDRGSIPVGTEVFKTSSIVFFSNTNEGNFGYVGTSLTSEVTSCPSTRDESRRIGMDYKGHRLIYEGGPLLGLEESRVLSTVRNEGILEQDRDLSHGSGSIRVCPRILLGRLNHSTHNSETAFSK